MNERAKAVATPGDEDCNKIMDGDEEQLSKEWQSKYRAMAARA